MNTFFTKETQKLVTYESDGVSSVVDYVLTRKNDMKDVKVIPGEECVSQHKLVVMDMMIKRSTEKKAKERWRRSWCMVKAPRRDGVLWNTISRMRQRKYVDGRKGERNVK